MDLSRKKYDPNINSKITEVYAGTTSNEIRVLAPMEFIFNEIGKYDRIIGLMSFHERQKLEPDLKGKNFLLKANEEHIQLMLIPDYYQDKLALDSFSLNDTVAGFRLVENNHHLMIWSKRMDNPPNERPKTSYRKGIYRYFGAFD